MEIIRRFFEVPGESFFLLGPRGTGKSTWVRQHMSDALFVDLLLPDVCRRLEARPERLREMVEAVPDGRAIVIDEVQKVPELLSVVHALIERKHGWMFVLTGSSTRKLRRGGVDLMAGRAILRTLHPFMAAELGVRFDLSVALRQGLLPIVWDARVPQDVLAGYASLYLREEVQVEGMVRHLGDFSRFLEEISFSHGQVLNISNVARECEVQRKTVEGYINILEDLLLSFRLPVFSRRARRAMTTQPKFYLFDAGVFRSLRPAGPLDLPAEIDGAALEGLVAQHLRAWAAYRGGRHELSFWRTRGGSEIDFVLYGPDGFWAVEVKNAGRCDGRDLRALRTFKGEYPESEQILLYRGDERLLIDGIHCMPCEVFLKQLHPSRLLI
jgi:predicted AAA+ superfamily ATPase